MKRLLPWLAAALPIGLLAQAPADTGRPATIRPIVIEAFRTPTQADRVPLRTVVVGDSTLRRLPALDVSEALRQTAAVDVVIYPGLLAGIGIRGFRPQTDGLNQRTLLLTGGRPAAATNIAALSPLLWQRIEVVKGPASALYGASAMGGVVNLVPYQSKGALNGLAFAEYGSFSTMRLGGRVGGRIGTSPLDFDVAVDVVDRNESFQTGRQSWLRDGFNLGSAELIRPNQPAQGIPDTRFDGTRSFNTRMTTYSGAARLGVQINPNWHAEVRGDRFEARDFEYPGDLDPGAFSSPGRKNLDRQAYEFRLEGKSGIHNITALGYYGDERTDYINTQNFDGSPIDTVYRSFSSLYQWVGAQVRDAIVLPDGQRLTVGADYALGRAETQSFRKNGTNRAPFSPDWETSSAALYAQGDLSLWDGQVLLRPGLRVENIRYERLNTPLLDNNTPGSSDYVFWSPSIGLVIPAVPGLDLVGNWGTSFVTPDAFRAAGRSVGRDFFTGATVLTIGNPDLKPERANTWEGGFRTRLWDNRLTLDGTYFRTEVRDAVSTSTQLLEVQADGTQVRTFVNTNRAVYQGIEYAIAYALGRTGGTVYSLNSTGTWLLTAKEFFQDPNGGPPREPQQARNVARFNGVFSASAATAGGFSARLGLRYSSRRLDDNFTTGGFVRYAPYVVSDLTLAQRLPLGGRGQHEASLIVANLTDENYYEKYGYNLPGRSISLRYTWQFGQ